MQNLNCIVTQILIMTKEAERQEIRDETHELEDEQQEELDEVEEEEERQGVE